MEQVREEAQKDLEYQFLWQQMEETKKHGSTSEYGVNEDHMLTFRGKVYVPNRIDLKELTMDEYHRNKYAGHQVS